MRTLCLALVAAAAASPAEAHAILLASVPALGAHVKPGPIALTLRFNSRIDAGRSKMTLTGAAGEQRLPSGAGDAPNLLQAKAASLPPGDYTIRWQVLATDGHITRGVVPFSVDP